MFFVRITTTHSARRERAPHHLPRRMAAKSCPGDSIRLRFFNYTSFPLKPKRSRRYELMGPLNSHEKR